MAYPTVSKTYGFKPLQRLDGLPYAGAIRQIPVAAGYATAILNGDTVAISGGYLVAKTATNSGDTVGVLVGCQYVNSSGQTVEGQYYPAAASTSSALAFGYVVDGQEKKIIGNVDKSVLAGQRIGILGANGQGKSTLVKTIARTMPQLSGTVTEGKGLNIGYFAQQELDVLRPGDNA